MRYNYPTKLTTSGLVSDTQGKLDALIDIFDISAEPTNGHILVYNSTSKHFDAQAPSGGGSGFDGTSNLVVSNGVSLLTPDSTAGITFQTSGSTFGSGVDYIQVGNVEAAANILPAGSSQNFGDATHRFDAFFGDLNVNGTITGFDTGDVAEGSNLYYTNARADARIAAASINALTDVDTTGVANGKILKYNSSTSKFEIADDGGSGSGIALTDLSVTTGSNSQNGGLGYNNSTGVFTFNPVAPTWNDVGTISIGGSITFNYQTATTQRAAVTVGNSGNITINTPTNMEQGGELTFILEGTGGSSGEDADMLWNVTNLKVDSNLTSGFNVAQGKCQIWKMIYDGTNYYAYKASNTDLT